MKYTEQTNIILCGLPGAGKTTVGHVLANLLNSEFIDTDALIEKLCGMSCRTYFQTYGEKAFREIEGEVIASLMEKKSCIIALGGGAIEASSARKLIPTLGIIVHLREELECLIHRKIEKEQPATVKNAEEYRNLANRRLPLLNALANIEINGSGKQSESISREIIELLRRQHGE
jgi:shikimate kinase